MSESYGAPPPTGGHPPYGQQLPYGGQPPYGQPVYGAEHPQASTIQILGIVGIFAPICCYIAWYMGSQAKKEIEAGAPYPFTGALKTGYLLGKIVSIISIVATVLIVLWVIFVIIAVAGTAATVGS